MRLISSDLALREIVALVAAAELSLTELASAVGSGPSAAQRALEVLLADKIVERGQAGPRPRYRLAARETAEHLVGLALAEVPADEALGIMARASSSAEFVARGRDKVVVVFGPASNSQDQARAARLIDRIAARIGIRVEYLDHDDVRRRLLDEPRLRSHVARMNLLYGSLDRSFPDRSRHGALHGRPLGKPNPDLSVPSRHALQTLLRRHRLASLKLFGSAVRSDFRPDSDVDALIRYQPGVRPSIRSMTEIERDLERLFGRDVHLIREEALEPEARAIVEREAVALQ